MESQRIKIIYILGAPRSGSTILSAILGMHERITAVGELSRLTLLHQGQPRICACGDPAWECVKWREVRELWMEEISPLTAEGYTSRLAQNTRLVSLPRLLIGRAYSSPDLHTLLAGTSALVKAIEAAFESSILVDSSKLGTRAMMYAMIPGIDLRVIQLIRDPRGYVQSRRSQLQRSSGSRNSAGASSNFAIKSAIRWSLTNLSDEAVGRATQSPRLRLRYEDLLTNPSRSLGRLGRLVGADLADVESRLDRLQEIGFGHMVAGNRVRLSGQAHFELDDAWRASISASHQRLIWAFGLPLSGLYGYSP